MAGGEPSTDTPVHTICIFDSLHAPRFSPCYRSYPELNTSRSLQNSARRECRPQLWHQAGIQTIPERSEVEEGPPPSSLALNAGADFLNKPLSAAASTAGSGFTPFIHLSFLSVSVSRHRGARPCCQRRSEEFGWDQRGNTGGDHHGRPVKEPRLTNRHIQMSPVTVMERISLLQSFGIILDRRKA